MTVGAVVVAAGSGVRFGEEGPRKQFRPLDGRPLAARACDPLLASDAVEAVVLVLPPREADDPPAWTRDLGVRVAAGGPERRDSVARGLASLPDGVATVLVHDGARPLASDDLVDRVLRAAGGEHGVVPVLRLRDTVKEVDGEGRVVRTLDRSRLRRVQTPQAFPLEGLRRAHRRAGRAVRATDDASLFEAAGGEVRTVPGDPDNLKVTTPADLERAAWILERRRAGAPR